MLITWLGLGEVREFRGEIQCRTLSPHDAKPKLYEVLIINYINFKQWNTKANYTEK